MSEKALGPANVPLSQRRQLMSIRRPISWCLRSGQLVDVTEYFVIATARNTPHVGAILEAMEDALRIECGVKPFCA